MIAIITLVTMGVLVIGPTVIRGINSHFKLWDDSIQDSYSDPMRKAPNNQGIPNNCVCEPDFQGAPGERCGASPCPVTQRLETKLCNPAGCGEGSGIVTQRCVDDPSCCDGYQDTDVCCLGSGPAPTNCPLGSRVTQRTCGGAGSQFSSRPDSADVGVDGNPSCVPRCLGQFASNEAAAQAEPSLPVICVDDDTGLPSTGLQQNPTGVGLPISLLGTGSNVCSHPPSPMPNNKCETYCLDNYHPQGNICVADCSCPEGEYYQGTGAGDCGAGNVYQGACPAGYYMVPPQACIPAGWVPYPGLHSRLSCAQVCTNVGKTSGPSPNGGHCRAIPTAPFNMCPDGLPAWFDWHCNDWVVAGGWSVCGGSQLDPNDGWRLTYRVISDCWCN